MCTNSKNKKTVTKVKSAQAFNLEQEIKPFPQTNASDEYLYPKKY
jgi:hypothetical protein